MKLMPHLSRKIFIFTFAGVSSALPVFMHVSVMLKRDRECWQ